MLLAALFAVAHTQSPLYYSNQNQYFLHGLAEAGYGHLSGDWLAQTRDPTPVFSALVKVGYQKAGEWVFHAAFFLLLMAYFVSARLIVAALPGVPDTLSFRLAFAAAFTAVHAAVVRIASVELTGVDYPWYLHCGVANQYLLGPGLQPSVFGVLLLAAVAAFAHRLPVLACGLAAFACVFHITYLLPTCFLVVGFIAVTVRERPESGRLALGMLLASSVFIAPMCTYMLWTFGPENKKVFDEAQRILSEVRIPHHSVVARWFALVDGVQVAWVVLALVLLRRSRLFGVVAIAAAFGFLLTLLQAVSKNPTFALLFPWRISAVLVPVATAVILGRLMALLPSAWGVACLAAGVLIGLAGGGAWVMTNHIGYRSGDDEAKLYEHVRTHAGPADVYLLPVRIPAVGTGRGTASATFTPPPRPDPNSNRIPVDLQRFRLHTGARIYVDFKSVPYGDLEVMIWLQRMRQCEEWYANWNRAGVRAELKGEGITHVVTPAARPIELPWLTRVHFDDPAYIVYRVE